MSNNNDKEKYESNDNIDICINIIKYILENVSQARGEAALESVID
jgi:transcription elongation factor GreA-like protein